MYEEYPDFNDFEPMDLSEATIIVRRKTPADKLEEAIRQWQREGFEGANQCHGVVLCRHKSLRKGSRAIPAITISGDWLQQAGLGCGTAVRIIPLDGALIICPDPELLKSDVVLIGRAKL